MVTVESNLVVSDIVIKLVVIKKIGRTIKWGDTQPPSLFKFLL